MRAAAVLFAATVIAAGIWFAWPVPKPAYDCGDILSAPSVHECDTTKGSVK